MDEGPDQDYNELEISPDPQITASDNPDEISQNAITSQPSSIYPLAQSQQAGHRNIYEQGQIVPMHPQGHVQLPATGLNTVQQQQVWLPMPQAAQVANCPPGLEYLKQIDQLLVSHQIKDVEIPPDYKYANLYVVKNNSEDPARPVYFAVEDSNFFMRNAIGSARSFDLKVIDVNTKRILLNIHRPLRCDSCYYFCCLNQLVISVPSTSQENGQNIGYVEQAFNIALFPMFRVRNGDRYTMFRIEGPIPTWSYCGSDVVFRIISESTGQIVGKITKRWLGSLKEYFSEDDSFLITFPMDMDPSMKATLLAALFLIDFMFFETIGKTLNRWRRKFGKRFAVMPV